LLSLKFDWNRASAKSEFNELDFSRFVHGRHVKFHKRVQTDETQKPHFSLYSARKSNAVKTSENRLFSIRSQMLYPVELRAPEKSS
jgi:hypothetical protein